LTAGRTKEGKSRAYTKNSGVIGFCWHSECKTKGVSGIGDLTAIITYDKSQLGFQHAMVGDALGIKGVEIVRQVPGYVLCFLALGLVSAVCLIEEVLLVNEAMNNTFERCMRFTG
jgi:hypothetical protein